MPKSGLIHSSALRNRTIDRLCTLGCELTGPQQVQTWKWHWSNALKNGTVMPCSYIRTNPCDIKHATDFKSGLANSDQYWVKAIENWTSQLTSPIQDEYDEIDFYQASIRVLKATQEKCSWQVSLPVVRLRQGVLKAALLWCCPEHTNASDDSASLWYDRKHRQLGASAVTDIVYDKPIAMIREMMSDELWS